MKNIENANKHKNQNCVCLEKGYGFSLAGGKGEHFKQGDEGFFIITVFPDTPAHRESSLKVDDKILEVSS